MSKQPTGPDEFGRLRVRDLDTGHERSINASQFAHGRYQVLDAPASHLGDPLPPKFHEPLSKPVESTTTRGQQADLKKENSDG